MSVDYTDRGQIDGHDTRKCVLPAHRLPHGNERRRLLKEVMSALASKNDRRHHMAEVRPDSYLAGGGSRDGPC